MSALLGLAVAGAAATTPIGAADLSAAAGDGWLEAVVAVGDLDARSALFRDVLGYELVHRGFVAPEQIRAWGIPEGETAHEALLREPGARRGFIRLVAFATGPGAGRIRSSAQPWEAGGWSGLNVRVREIDAVFGRLQAAGFQGFSDPVSFSVPPFQVREAMMVGPDGLVLGLLERVAPPLAGPGWTSLASRPVTAFSVTDRPEETEAALRRLSLAVRLSFDGPTAEPGPNLFALPHTLVGQTTRSVRWWQESGREEGTIATIAFGGLSGRSFAEDARPPSLGLFTLRLPVPDAGRRCAAAGATIFTAEIAPYGRVRSCVVRLPNGAQLDLVQAD